MSVLVIDTSSRRRCAAVLCGRDGGLLARALEPSSGTAVLGGVLATLLGAPAASGLEAVVVVTGPGSYTGVRGGMAAGLGVAQARGLPLHGLGSLEPVAQGAPPDLEKGVALAPAGRDAVYVAAFSRSAGAPEAPSPGAARAVEAAAPSRLTLAEAAELEGPLVAAEEIAGLPGVELVADLPAALAAAAVLAVRRPALDTGALRMQLAPVVPP